MPVREIRKSIIKIIIIPNKNIGYSLGYRSLSVLIKRTLDQNRNCLKYFKLNAVASDGIDKAMLKQDSDFTANR